MYTSMSFMSSNKSSIDGFIPRRTGSQLGDLHAMKNPDAAVKPIDRTLHTGDNATGDLIGSPRSGKVIGRSDIDESLREIDDPELDGKSTRKSRRQAKRDAKRKKPVNKVKRGIIIALIALLVIGAGIVGYVVIKGIFASGNIFKGGLIDIVKNEPLKQDANGRSNFLIFGTAEDDEGGEHGGANLTDSIMILSVDQNKKNAYMLSLPRDLWVQYQETCWVGNQGKLNAAYSCASDDGKNEEAGAEALQKTVADITGLEIQYYIHLNFTAVVEAVNAVGGVDVTIQSEDPRGIQDRNFDWKCRYQCYFVNYKNGEVAHLDGEHALALARARNASGGYGLPNGNFDREKNQQLIIKALREKALTAGTLTNLGSVTGLIDALGNNLRTNVETKEIRTLMDLATKIETDNIISLSLNEEGNMLVTTGSYNGQSIVRPVAGIMDYSEIHAYIEKELTSDPFVKEEPHITVLNGTGTSGVGQQLADKLADQGFIVDAVDNAPEGTYDAIVIYQIDPEKVATAAKLKEMYGVKINTSNPPVSVVGETDFLIIVGHQSVVTAGR